VHETLFPLVDFEVHPVPRFIGVLMLMGLAGCRCDGAFCYNLYGQAQILQLDKAVPTVSTCHKSCRTRKDLGAKCYSQS
jgi:hypothetical protein